MGMVWMMWHFGDILAQRNNMGRALHARDGDIPRWVGGAVDGAARDRVSPSLRLVF